MSTIPTAPSMKAALFQLIENVPVHMEFVKIGALLKRVEFLALVKEGFTEAQAIDLLRPKA